ncbi:flagellar biosynthesis protein FliS [Cytobacillus firmus]|nr:flagellar biosynthesis protein FliS [Cytobacillus firmus]MBG9554048.1 flagellar biosynthesis protein FliS [Cytobacillus firmus]MBG9558488.1 flagellar biosynthesis protein FliS [Cytobacillus firmus]MBG9577085.1 flagellar biosynthesis protein FliS [Cytobacillus firmus]
MIYQKSSQEITALLYEKCLMNLEESISYIESKEYISANERLQNTNDILQRLGVGINYESGIIADQLDLLYNYMADELVKANRSKDTAKIENVMNILQSIAAAWNEAMKNKPNSKMKSIKHKVNAYEKNVLTEEKIR